MGQKTYMFLTGLKYVNYFLLVSYISIQIGISYFKEEKHSKYRNILNTIYTLGIGILLISIQYPILFDSRQHPNEVSALMFSAGIIVLTTLRIDDIKQLRSFIVSFSKPKKTVRFNLS